MWLHFTAYVLILSLIVEQKIDMLYWYWNVTVQNPAFMMICTLSNNHKLSIVAVFEGLGMLLLL